MKLSAQEEYGLRCLLRLAGAGEGQSLTIPEIGRAEALSIAYVAKLMRILRQGKFVKSVRGQTGGYTLARSPETKHEYILAARELLKAASPETKLYAPPNRDQDCDPGLRA